MALGDGFRDGEVTLPALLHHVRAEGEVPLQEHFLPHYRGEPRSANFLEVEVDELLQQGLDDCGGVGFNGWVKTVGVDVEPVATGVEVGAVRRYSRKHVTPEFSKELVDSRVVQLELARGRLGAVVAPTRLNVKRGYEFGE